MNTEILNPIYSTMEILWKTYGATNEDLNEQLYDLMLDIEEIIDFGSTSPIHDAMAILDEANKLINSKK